MLINIYLLKFFSFFFIAKKNIKYNLDFFVHFRIILFYIFYTKQMCASVVEFLAEFC